MSRRTAIGVAFAAIACVTRAAQADEGAPDLELSWNAIEDCPSREAVQLDVRRILNGAPTRHAVAHADVSRLAPHRWSVHLTTRVEGVSGERSLEADSCEALASATALILAWTIDPLHAGSAAAAAPISSSAPLPPAAPVPPPLPPSAATPPPPALRAPFPTKAAPAPAVARRSSGAPLRPSALVAMSLAGDVGTLPKADVGGELTVGLVVGRLRAEVAAGDWLSVAKINPTAGGASLHMFDGAVRGCFRLALGAAVELAPCLGVGIDYTLTQALGTSTPLSQNDATWTLARGEALLTWRLFGPLSLRGRVGLALPFDHPSFVINQPAPSAPTLLYRVGTASGLAGIGVEAHFP